ncbi:hypothetical protein BTUL_0567g00020 [Botrytis tulipae]|uniref:Uncharacterized protein n=1 Tax=Botrytis tulipae TaxID=87230 RepID=A0A4Z1E3U1_9HELO|nr:hypothetical protein BTUL_0567g00020 [Botrytis tulipae]
MIRVSPACVRPSDSEAFVSLSVPIDCITHREGLGAVSTVIEFSVSIISRSIGVKAFSASASILRFRWLWLRAERVRNTVGAIGRLVLSLRGRLLRRSFSYAMILAPEVIGVSAVVTIGDRGDSERLIVFSADSSDCGQFLCGQNDPSLSIDPRGSWAVGVASAEGSVAVGALSCSSTLLVYECTLVLSV